MIPSRERHLVRRAFRELRGAGFIAQTFSVGDLVYVKSPAGYRRLARILSARSQRERGGRRDLWLVRMRNSLRWTQQLWLPVERALNSAEVRRQRMLGFIDENGEPS